jgi:ABC-type transporter Mla subunit MlaD
MSSISIWTRLGNWLRLSQSQADGDAAEASGREQAHTTDSLTVANEPVSAGEATGVKRWQRREQVLQNLQEGYAQVIELLTTLQQHLQTGDQHARQADQALARLTESMKELPAQSGRQTELLDRVGQEMEKQGRQQERIAEFIEQWPETARDQSELLKQLHQELGAGQQAQAELADALQSVSRAVGELSETTRQGSRLLAALDQDGRSRQEQVLAVLEAQSKRITQLVWAAMGLSAVAIVGALMALLLHYQGGP